MQPDLEPAHGRAARWQHAATHALSSFGLLLTGRLELRNEILSALSVHTKTPFQPRESQREHEVWEERYFVLTRKALHYYIRARGDRSGKDGMFGKHEGTIGFNRIAAVVEDAANREVELVTRGPGRNYVLRAKSRAAYEQWASTLLAASRDQFGSRA